MLFEVAKVGKEKKIHPCVNRVDTVEKSRKNDQTLIRYFLIV